MFMHDIFWKINVFFIACLVCMVMAIVIDYAIIIDDNDPDSYQNIMQN